MTDPHTDHMELLIGDDELLVRVRNGDTDSFEELYTRHAGAARGLARQLVRSESEVDDAVAETFARVLAVLGRGGGPTDGFRPYLLTALRHVVYDRFRGEKRQVVTDDMEKFDSGEPFVDPALAGLERSLIARAYLSLPERWQAVLWYTEIEGVKPADAAPSLGMNPNGVAALAYRAREGLRQAYLQMHLAGGAAESCRPAVSRLGAYVRGGLAKRDTASVDRHLDECGHCREVYAELMDVNVGLRGIVLPLFAGPAAAAYLAAAGGVPLGFSGWWQRLPKRGQQAAAGGTAAAAVAAAVAFALVSNEEPVKPPQAERPAAAAPPAQPAPPAPEPPPAAEPPAPVPPDPPAPEPAPPQEQEEPPPPQPASQGSPPPEQPEPAEPPPESPPPDGPPPPPDGPPPPPEQLPEPEAEIEVGPDGVSVHGPDGSIEIDRDGGSVGIEGDGGHVEIDEDGIEAEGDCGSIGIGTGGGGDGDSDGPIRADPPGVSVEQGPGGGSVSAPTGPDDGGPPPPGVEPEAPAADSAAGTGPPGGPGTGHGPDGLSASGPAEGGPSEPAGALALAGMAVGARRRDARGSARAKHASPAGCSAEARTRRGPEDPAVPPNAFRRAGAAAVADLPRAPLRALRAARPRLLAWRVPYPRSGRGSRGSIQTRPDLVRLWRGLLYRPVPNAGKPRCVNLAPGDEPTGRGGVAWIAARYS